MISNGIQAPVLSIKKEDTQMALRINDTAPDFTADTTEGSINFHD